MLIHLDCKLRQLDRAQADKVSSAVVASVVRRWRTGRSLVVD